MSATAYERIVDKLHDLDLRVRTGYNSSVAQCPSHDDRQPSLAVYDKDGKAKIVCFAGCDDALDILPALDMTVADLYDERRIGKGAGLDAEALARHKARKTMTPPQRAVDDLLQLPDLGERLCLGIARMRPELYIWEREQLASDASDASLASDSLGVWEAMHDVFPGVPQDSGTDGDKLLLKVRQWWATYISTVTEADLDLLTLFAAHTHLIVESYTTPRLQLDSPVHGSGKTTCLEHFQRLCHRSVQMASLSSPALLTRMLDAELRTVLIDEADRSLNPEKDGIADLLAVLNSGLQARRYPSRTRAGEGRPVGCQGDADLRCRRDSRQ